MMNCDEGSNDIVIGKIKAVHGVVEAHELLGVYDLIAKVHSDTTDGLKETVRKLRMLDNVASSLTLVVPGS